MQIRQATIEDLPAINDIYNQSIPGKISTADMDPVTMEERKIWYDSHDKDHPVFVAVINEQLVGWISISAYRPGRRALRYTSEVSYFIHNDFQKRGIGSKLMEYAIRKAPKHGVKKLFAILLETNLPSIMILEKFEFEKWAHLPGVADFDGEEVGQFYYGRRV